MFVKQNPPHKAGVAVSPVNPAKVRHYAKAAGKLAKTDATGARVITGFAECFKPVAAEQKSPEQEALQQAVRRTLYTPVLRHPAQSCVLPAPGKCR